MSRYFIELAYKGTQFKGFQLQHHVATVQGEVNAALRILLKESVETTTSSRTDAGVHALQNFLHFDTEVLLKPSFIYNINAILHPDILVKNIIAVNADAHARFDASSRKYAYHIINTKHPFLKETAWHMPFKTDIDLMNEAAQKLMQHTNFESFSKRNTDVKTFECNIHIAYFEKMNEEIIFHVASNRFLRGMVRALVATLILVGRKKVSLSAFEKIIAGRDCTKADFSAPAHGLFLEKVNYPASVFSVNQTEPLT